MLMTRRPGSPVKKPHLEHMKRRIKVVERRSSSMRLSTRVKMGFDEATEQCSGVLLPREKDGHGIDEYPRSR